MRFHALSAIIAALWLAFCGSAPALSQEFAAEPAPLRLLTETEPDGRQVELAPVFNFRPRFLRATQASGDALGARDGRGATESASAEQRSAIASYPELLPEFQEHDGAIQLAAMQEVDDTDQKVPAKPETKPDSKKDAFPTFKITGFTQFDGDWNSQSPNNRATVGDMQDGVGFRRTRLAVVGKAAELTNYMLEVDYAAAGRPSFFDVWGEQEQLPFFGTVRAGQFVEPFSVDAMSGFRHLMFLERSLPFFAFVPFRRIGLEAYSATEDERTNWAYSVFRTGGFGNSPFGDDRFATDIGDVGGYSFSTRATHLLYYDDNAGDRYLWHIGAAYDYSRLGANTAAGSASPVPFYQARTPPEFFMGFPESSTPLFGPTTAAGGTPNFVDTGRYAADSFNLFGLETVWQAGPTSFQAEWMGTVVQSAVGPIFYNGAYAQIAYRLTGENRVYYKKISALGNVVPYTDFISLRPGGVKGWGAWEVAARWSFVELLNPASLEGHYLANTNSSGNGSLNDSTVGMTWFLNAHTKVQFNWICAMLENRDKGFSLANLYVTRLQIDF